MNHIVIGTAGHVDHGKTALIKALTGQDADRLPEEKRRGLTIDLGFAWCDLSESIRAGFIDVPGHERFIANMTGGVGGMDTVLFVVAADEGLMPQSYEHLDILQILGVGTGIIVITRTDLADRDTINSVRDQISTDMAGTFLEKAPVVEASSLTGDGIEEVRSHLLTVSEQIIKEKSNSDRNQSSQIPRLPIDRVFTVSGFGTVVTGTLAAGEITADSRIMLMPSQIPCKIRGMQSYGEKTQNASAGQRLAINLSNIKTDQVHRGDIITGTDQTDVAETDCLNVSLISAGHSKKSFESGMRVQMLIGTDRAAGKLFLFRDAWPFGQVRLDETVCAAAGDRFILRSASPMTTIGGGSVIETKTRKCRISDHRTIERLKNKAEGRLDPVSTTDHRHTDKPEHLPGKHTIPERLRKPADWIMSLLRESGYKLISVNSFGQDRYDDKTIRMTLRELKKCGMIIQIDEVHYTTVETADQAVTLIRRSLSDHGELSIAELRDLLDTNRKSARLFLEYTDRKKITRIKGGAAVREAFQ